MWNCAPCARDPVCLAILKQHQPTGAINGVLTNTTEDRMEVRSRIGGLWVIDGLSGEQLPRIS